MCGITSIIRKDGNRVDYDVLKAMTDIIRHRGPDGEGFYLDKNIGLGHRRLSIIDLSENAKQPFQIQDYILTYNGEIFNFIELRDELVSLGHTFSSTSDTEVLLKAYIEWGEACVHRLNGMWAFVIYDIKSQKIFCSRDRFGIKPLYYWENAEALYITSEIKQFSCIPKWSPTINTSRLYDYLEYSRLNHTDETLFDGVNCLGKGCNLVYDLQANQYSIYKYYDLKKKVKEEIEDDEQTCIKHFRNLLKDAVTLRLRSDVKLGASLSGGLDSSTITALATKQTGNIHSFSAVFDEKNLSEKAYLDAFLAKYPIQNTTFSPSFENVYPHLEKTIWHTDQPVTAIGDVVEFLLYEQQHKNGIKVSLAGQGADEILAGYLGFYRPYVKTMLKRMDIPELFGFTQHYFSLNTYSKSFFFGKRKDSTYIKPFEGYSPPITSPTPQTIKEKSIFAMNHDIDLLLFYEDRSAMAHSVESRQPFMDHRLIEYAIRLPDSYKIRKGTMKYILREAMKDILPHKIYHRKDKLGYVTPQKRWIFEHRNTLVQEIKNGQLKHLISENVFSSLKNTSINKSDDAFVVRLLACTLWLKRWNIEL